MNQTWLGALTAKHEAARYILAVQRFGGSNEIRLDDGYWRSFADEPIGNGANRTKNRGALFVELHGDLPGEGQWKPIKPREHHAKHGHGGF